MQLRHLQYVVTMTVMMTWIQILSRDRQETAVQQITAREGAQARHTIRVKVRRVAVAQLPAEAVAVGLLQALHACPGEFLT
jgi:hypothetical protein